MASIQNLRRQGSRILGLLDVGTSKAVCLVVVAPARGGLEGVQVLGAGCAPSRGIKAGVVTDLDAAEQSVRAAVSEAEHSAGTELRQVLLAVACGRLKSATFAADASIDGRVVMDADIARLLAAGRTYSERGDRALVHMNCIGYRLDGGAGTANPRGLAGRMLSADLHAVTADDAPLCNLIHVVERAYLSTSGLLPAPYASGIAVTSSEERQTGVAAIDFGAGTTSLCLFAEGHLLANEVIPVGGNHLTFDLARSLQTSPTEAERIKTLYGRVGAPADDDQERVSFTLAGEEVPTLCQVAKGRVREVIGNRVTALLGQLAERVDRSAVANHAMQRMVVTGGASQLPGLTEFVSQFFARPVRVSEPEAIRGMPASVMGPGFSTARGLVRLAIDPAAGVRRDASQPSAGGYLKRVGRWLQASF